MSGQFVVDFESISGETISKQYSFDGPGVFVGDSGVGCPDPLHAITTPEAQFQSQMACEVLDDCGDCGGLGYSCRGCMDMEACNFDPEAIYESFCEYSSCLGCTDLTACNFESHATIDDGTCSYAPALILGFDANGDSANAFLSLEILSPTEEVVSGDFFQMWPGTERELTFCLEPGCYSATVNWGETGADSACCGTNGEAFFFLTNGSDTLLYGGEYGALYAESSPIQFCVRQCNLLRNI